MATAFAWYISAVVKMWSKSEIISFFFYPGPIGVISGFYPGVADRKKIHIISDSVQILTTALMHYANAVGII